MSHEFRLKDTAERRNYFLIEIKQNELTGKKQKKACTTLNYICQFIILASPFTGCISTSAYTCLIGISIGTTSSEIGLTICAIAAGIKSTSR